jgi:hypothetical protein
MTQTLYAHMNKSYKEKKIVRLTNPNKDSTQITVEQGTDILRWHAVIIVSFYLSSSVGIGL